MSQPHPLFEKLLALRFREVVRVRPHARGDLAALAFCRVVKIRWVRVWAAFFTGGFL
jgi:hypothetical protein